jgi:hypothetical protein
MPHGLAACAHVKPDGEPCSDSPAGVYDEETMRTIADEDALWDPELEGIAAELRDLGHGSVAARKPKKADRRAAARGARRQDDKTEAALAKAPRAPNPLMEEVERLRRGGGSVTPMTTPAGMPARLGAFVPIVIDPTTVGVAPPAPRSRPKKETSVQDIDEWEI